MSKFGHYEQMVSFSEHLWIIHEDGLVTEGRTLPTREELIDGYMLIPRVEYRRRTDGKPGYEQVGEATHATREEAEYAVAAFLGEPRQETKAA